MVWLMVALKLRRVSVIVDEEHKPACQDHICRRHDVEQWRVVCEVGVLDQRHQVWH